MTSNAIELLSLDNERKWQYLSRYFETVSSFYDIRDDMVTDVEIDACLRRIKSKPKPIFRKQLELNDWRFKLDMENQGIREGYFAGDYDESGWDLVSIPHAFSDVPSDPIKFGRTDNAMFANERRTGEYCDIWRGESHAWYKSRLVLDELRNDEIVYLTFESVNLLSDVWVNEYPVMTDHLGLFPFKIEITEELKAFYSRSPVIAVKVSNIASNVPCMFYNGFQLDYSDAAQCSGRHEMDWRNDSSAGIAGEAVLSVLNKNHIENAFLFTRDIFGDKAQVAATIELKNDSWAPFEGRIEVEISEWLPAESDIVWRGTFAVTTLPMNGKSLTLEMLLENCKVWSVESPNMYLAHIVLVAKDGTALDDIYETFGVRTIRIKGSFLYLNGRKFVPRGTHDICHYFNEPQICPSDGIIVKDLLLHKKMGANCSRWPSDARMHYPRIAEICDQLGYLLSWAGFFEVWNTHSEAEMYNARDVKAMVRSLRNHPSIIFWEMGDEVLSFSCDSRRIRWLEMMYNLVVAEDKTRPVIPMGAWCNDLMRAIRNYEEQDLPIMEKRERVLELFPTFDRELALWDVHDCPYYPPFNPILPHIDEMGDLLEGQKPTILTEFGIDGMPDPRQVKNVYGKFRWGSNPFYIISKSKMDLGCYGRELTEKDWRESQAFQALTDVAIVDRIRQSPEKFAGYYFVTMFDVWTFFWGAVDANGRCKLAYFAMQAFYQPVCVSSLHGHVTVDKSRGLRVSLSNYGDDISGASLHVVIKNENRTVIQETSVAVFAKGDVAVTRIADIDVSGLPDGLFEIEHYLESKDGTRLAKTVELAYFE